MKSTKGRCPKRTRSDVDSIQGKAFEHANLGAEAVPLVSQRSDGETIFRLGGSDSGGLAPWTVIWSISEA